MGEFVTAIKGIRKDDIIIAFIGPTGAGKSYFIDLLTGQQGQRAGNSLKSVTSQIQATRVKHPVYGDRVILVDTPGFDDTTRSDTQTLEMIDDWLGNTYEKGVKLSGLIYLHRITDNRMANSPNKHLHMFGELCGDTVMNQVILVSTMWEKVKHNVGETREQELVNKFWKELINKGSKVDRLERSTGESAWTVVDQLIKDREEREAVLLQGEFVELGNELKERAAGKNSSMCTGDRDKLLSDAFQKLLTVQQEVLDILVVERKESKFIKDMQDMSRVVQNMFRGIIAKFEEIFKVLRKLGIRLSQWIMALFFGKKTRAEDIRVKGTPGA